MRAEQFFFGNPFESEFDLPPGFMGGVAVPEQEEEEEEQEQGQQEETTPAFTLPSGGDSNLDILGDALVGSGLLSTTIDFGAPALAGAATGIGAGGTPVFNSTPQCFNKCRGNLQKLQQQLHKQLQQQEKLLLLVEFLVKSFNFCLSFVQRR